MSKPVQTSFLYSLETHRRLIIPLNIKEPWVPALELRVLGRNQTFANTRATHPLPNYYRWGASQPTTGPIQHDRPQGTTWRPPLLLLLQLPTGSLPPLPFSSCWWQRVCSHSTLCPGPIPVPSAQCPLGLLCAPCSQCPGRSGTRWAPSSLGQLPSLPSQGAQCPEHPLHGLSPRPEQTPRTPWLPR